MIKSMTAFASVSEQDSWGSATWEIRSVNHRFLEINLRLPESFSSVEINFRKVIQKYLQRGKVDCSLTFTPGESFLPQLKINQPLMSNLLNNLNELRNLHGDVCLSSPAIDLLRWPEMVSKQYQDYRPLEEPLTQLLCSGVEQLIAVRQAEGESIFRLLENKLEGIIDIIHRARPRVGASLEKQKQKLEARLAELQIDDETRLAQEMVIYASKWDVEEELDRLQCHYQEVRSCLQQTSPTGRRLDFLMQEMNREANTLAAKSQDTTLSQLAVDLKVSVEQMREQIQNVE